MLIYFHRQTLIVQNYAKLQTHKQQQMYKVLQCVGYPNIVNRKEEFNSPSQNLSHHTLVRSRSGALGRWQTL